MARMTAAALYDLLIGALTAQGFSPENAAALTRQTVLTEELGQPNVGVAHVFDYIDGLAQGRIEGWALPTVSLPAPTMIHVDGNGGLAQSGFDKAFDDLVGQARQLGLALFVQKNTMLCGALGTFALRLAEAGLVAIAATNGSPLLAGSGAKQPVYCTNPMAFAAPQTNGPPLLIDQSSSATAYVNIRAAAERSEEIPLDWAIDKDGQPTADAKAALAGTMLAFGGARGANIALMVEVLAAGLSGANWSLDAPPFDRGDRSPASGLFVLAIDPGPLDANFSSRLAAQTERLSRDYGVHIPGLAKAKARQSAAEKGLDIDDGMISRLREMLG